MRILVTGITGYVGSLLADRLRSEGHEVRGMARHPAGDENTVLRGDVVSGQGLHAALDGIDVAYFLVHSMEGSSNGAFADRERRGAENFARAASGAGVERIIYLGGPVPGHGRPSPHLASRLAVEEILLDASPCSVALRASIVIGARSRSFRFMVHLVERMPVLALPAWRARRTAPIDERDVISMLARAASVKEACGRSLDASGLDTVSYGELIERIRDHMLISRPVISLGRLTLTPIASRVASVIASEDHGLIGPLMEGLADDLLPRDASAGELLGVRMHTLDGAIERSLRLWEASEPLAAR